MSLRCLGFRRASGPRACRAFTLQAADRAAFTLIELLVVVAIIALLVAILIPSLARAKSNAQTSACLANQRSIAQAVTVYASEWDQWVPVDGLSGDPRAFYAPLLVPLMGGPAYDYVQLNDTTYCTNYLRPLKFFKCPAMRKDNDLWVLHYEVNGVDFRRVYNGGSWAEPVPGFTKVTIIRHPQEAVYSVEVNGDDPPPSLGVVQIYKPDHLPFGSNIRMIKANDQRHRGLTTTGFFDGHAEAVPLKPTFWNERAILGEAKP